MLLFCDIKEVVLMHSRGRAFPFELEDHDSIVVTCSEEIDFGVSCNNPETIVVAFEGLYGSPLVEVPDSHGFVFANREYQILMWMEKASRGILEVSTTGVYFPRFGLCSSISAESCKL